jgi:signal transduction histidine kinase
MIALRAYRTTRSALFSTEIRSRLHLIGSGFCLLAINSTFHASIHAFRWNQNLLYQTLLGYCLGLLIIIIAISSEKPWNKKLLPLLYLPLLVMIHPDIYKAFPIFGQFRPLMWVIISYLSGVICMLYIAVYYRTEAQKYLLSSLGHGLICTSAILLFFPAGIGSNAWIYGHLFRPLGFIILFFSMKQEDLTMLKGSILYKTLTAFSLLASIPLLVYGTVMIYENLTPINIMGRSLIVFILLLATLASALFFGFGLIISLLRPILRLKDSVSRLVDRDLDEKLEISSNDEIGELSEAYNDMVVKLRHSVSEKDRLSRLAATGELSATLAHEIKNPLHAIDVAATYLRNNYKGKLIREFIKIIQTESSRINKLTTSLLNFAKPVKAELKKGDINKLVAEMVSLLREESAERNIHIELKQEQETPAFSFDYNQIKQVLLNLLINAFDAVDEEGCIKVETSTSNGNVLLSVEDSGKGIPEEDLENIFNPFYTTKTRGTGLGLAISKKIAKEHGGNLHIESSPAKGSTFTLVLPIRT